VLAQYLVFVSAFGYLMLGLPKWRSRLAIAIALEVYKALAGGSFHELIIWSASVLMFLAWAHAWSKKRILAFVVVGVFSIMLIDAIKRDYRDQFWYTGPRISESRLLAFTLIAFDAATSPSKIFGTKSFTELLERLNQGWIVNSAMRWTPAIEPYARGRTLIRDMTAGMLPRALFKGKGVVSGREDYERYTGYSLLASTSMALGTAGEMYVNFGREGGVLAVGIYGLLLGLGYRALALQAARHPLWWIWVPYFGSVAVKAETSVGVLFSWLVKGAIVMAVVLWKSPALRRIQLPEIAAKSPPSDRSRLPNRSRAR